MTAAKKVSKKKIAETVDQVESDSVGNSVQAVTAVQENQPAKKNETVNLAEKIQKIADHLVFLEKKLDNLLEQSKSQGAPAPRPSFGGDRPFQSNRPSGGFQGNRDGGFRGNSSGGYRGNRDSGGSGFRGGREGGSGGGYQKFGSKPYFNKGGSSSYGGGSQGGGYRPGGPSRDRGGDSRPSYNKPQGGEPGNA